MADMSSAIAYIDVELVAITERAVLVHTGDSRAAVWLPLALIEVSATSSPCVKIVALPEWLAIKAGLA